MCWIEYLILILNPVISTKMYLCIFPCQKKTNRVNVFLHSVTLNVERFSSVGGLLLS